MGVGASESGTESEESVEDPAEPPLRVRTDATRAAASVMARLEARNFDDLIEQTPWKERPGAWGLHRYATGVVR